MSDIKNLVVGCGFSGITVARKIAEELNEKVVIAERKNHICGNSYDYRDENGIMIHKYGSHIFHTDNEEVWNFLNRFGEFNNYMHKVIAVIDGIETTIPFNFKSIYDVFPPLLAQRLEAKLLNRFKYNTKVPILEFLNQNDEELKFLAEYVYEKVYYSYTKKQWGNNPKLIDTEVTARVPIYLSCDCRYFQDKYQGIPLQGYTKLAENIINHPNIELKLNTDYKEIKEKYDRIFYTGSIDEFFEYKFGELPYRSIKLKLEKYEREYYQKGAVVNYPCNYDYTRIHEYKYYLNNQSPVTIIAKEYPSQYKRGINERYYPIENKENRRLYESYLKEAEGQKNIYFLGRLGDYKYYNIDKAIQRALELINNIK